jgi:hypothetical protein
MAKRRGPVSKTGVPPKPKAHDPVASGRQRDRQRRSDEATKAQARRDYSEKVVPASMRTVGSQTGMPKDGRRGRASQDPRYR